MDILGSSRGRKAGLDLGHLFHCCCRRAKPTGKDAPHQAVHSKAQHSISQYGRLGKLVRRCRQTEQGSGHRRGCVSRLAPVPPRANFHTLNPNPRIFKSTILLLELYFFRLKFKLRLSTCSSLNQLHLQEIRCHGGPLQIMVNADCHARIQI